ncbi:MAG TPA: hypothetical protein VFC44_08925 [Candidatus Saccharimonadales bacterium]|nr:hypothetical protein [Candidatus Saccharimonadales bacterium]
MSKAAKHRFCPAVQREISAAECGQNRGSRYACPSACLYSPLAPANYSLLLELESEVDRKSAERFAAEERKSPELQKLVQQISFATSPHAYHAFFSNLFFFKRDSAGLSFADRWRKENFPGLKNDERVLFEAKTRTRIALLEIHRIIDSEQIEAVDLLTAAPEPIVLRDRSLAAVASRFSTILAWVYPLPHYWRLHGTVIILPEIGQFEPVEILHETARRLGGPTTEKELRLWLVENFVRVDESLMATGRMRQMQMFAGMDADFGKAVYELRAPFGACRAALDEIAEVEPESLTPVERDEGFAESRVWLTQEDPAKTSENPMILGRVLLGQSHCRLEAIGRERLGRLRQQFEKALGDRARFASERFDDLASKLKGQESPPNMALIPPRLLEAPNKFAFGSSRVERPAPGVSFEEVEAQQRARHYRAFLDNTVAALDGHTPREAAQDPALRPKLIHLLKLWVRQHDETNLSTGRDDDINWLLRELGATEILFDAPPPRARYPKPGASEKSDADDVDDFDDFIDDGDFPWPVLSPEPLSASEASDRLGSIYDDFETAQDALDYLEGVDSCFIEDAAELCERQMAPEEFNLFMPSLVQVRFVLVPRGFREPELNRDRLSIAFDESLRKFRQKAKGFSPDMMVRWLENCRQPALAEEMTLTLSTAFRELPSNERPDPFSELLMIVTLRHMIDELDESIRQVSQGD